MGIPTSPERMAAIVACYLALKSVNRTCRHMKANSRLVYRALKEAGVPRFSQSEAQSGSWNPSWNGGRTMLGEYVYIHSPYHPYATKAGYVAEHRLVVESLIGRYLLPSEVVHHKEDPKDNNDPSNLQLFGSNGEHLAFELKGRVPKWSEDGKRRMDEGAAKPRKLSAEQRQRRQELSRQQALSRKRNHLGRFGSGPVQKTDAPPSPSPTGQTQT